jgi:hypothetical protein
MTKLNQIIAVEKGIKSRVYGEITALNKIVQKPNLFNGFNKTYAKKDEDGEDLPAERMRVQHSVGDVLRTVERISTELMDVTARKDWTNTGAKATVTVAGKPILTDVPVTYLLFLEKQLTDFHTLVGNLPVLDEGETWMKDVNSGLYKSEQTSTHRTKKVAKVVVLLQPTEHHPGQAQVMQEDVIAGFWNQVKHSGAMPKLEKQALVERVEALLKAIKEAREEANGQTEIAPPNVGGAIFNYLLQE